MNRTIPGFWRCMAVVLALWAWEALAGPPFLTDDPEPVDYQHWEFYVASMDFKVGRDWSGTAPHVELNYGAVSNLQLHVIAPMEYNAPSGGAAHYGYGDIELGTKFRFAQETEHMPQMGVFPLLEVPTGSARDNLGNGSLQAILPLWLQKSWGSWTAYGGGGYGVNSGAGNQDWEFAGAVLQKQVLTNVLIGAEVYHQTPLQTGGRDDTTFNIGTVIDFSEQQHLLFSVGRSIDGPTKFQCYIAWQFTFDNRLFKPHSGIAPGK